MATTRKTSVIITQMNMIKKSKHTDTKIHQNTEKDSRLRDNGLTKQQYNNQQNGNRKFLLINNCLNVNKLNSAVKKRHRMAEWTSKKKKKDKIQSYL